MEKSLQEEAQKTKNFYYYEKEIGQLHCFLSCPHCVFAFMFSPVVFHLWANNCTIEMYCILGADKLRRISSLQSTNALQFLQI